MYDRHKCGPESRNAQNKTIAERLETLEEMVATDSKTVSSVAKPLTLEQRVARLEGVFVKDLGGHLQLRPNELRPKTLLTTPIISGSSNSRIHTINALQDAEAKCSDFASSLPLLGSLHQKGQELRTYVCYGQPSVPNGQHAQSQLDGPALQPLEFSLGFIPLENVRPFVMTTVFAIAIIARRLGMSWESFNPEAGSMKAQGNGQAIVSIPARPTGRVLQYTSLKNGVTTTGKSVIKDFKKFSDSELYVSTREADMMGFGLLPGCDDLNIPSFQVGTNEDVYATMDFLDTTRKASAKLRDVNRLLVGKWDEHCMYGFSDIIALAAPMIHRKHCAIIRVPAPAEYSWSLLSQKECFVVFYNRLKHHLCTISKAASLEQAGWVLEKYQYLKMQYNNKWENGAENSNQVSRHDLIFLGDVHRCWISATKYLVQIQEKHGLHYLDLMASHISNAVNYWGDAWQRLREGRARENYGLRALEAEGAHLYFDYLPLIVKDMRAKGFEGPERIVHEAWFTLMFRAFCWWRCHDLNLGADQGLKGSPLPSRYWDCKLPVYIC